MASARPTPIKDSHVRRILLAFDGSPEGDEALHVERNWSWEASVKQATPATYLTTNEIRQIADTDFEAASEILSASRRKELRQATELLRTMETMKGYLASIELRPPK
jgi:hypothetical protein